jgi:hypothetical protein
MSTNQDQQEIWRSMDEYPGYVFSNTGKVYSYKSKRCITGSRSGRGYIYLKFRDYNNKKENPCLNRIIYYLFGDEPELLPYREVDHINRERKDDNNINNLRLATREENLANQGKRQSNNQGNQCSSEYVGVSWNKQSKKWQSEIHIGKKFYLGKYKFVENAGYVYNRIASCFKPPNHWLNTLPGDFELPTQEEDREYKISQAIAKINQYLGIEQ